MGDDIIPIRIRSEPLLQQSDRDFNPAGDPNCYTLTLANSAILQSARESVRFLDKLFVRKPPCSILDSKFSGGLIGSVRDKLVEGVAFPKTIPIVPFKPVSTECRPEVRCHFTVKSLRGRLSFARAHTKIKNNPKIGNVLFIVIPAGVG